MIERKNKPKTLANRAEVEKVAEEIRRREFARLVILSDAVNRFVETRFKDKINWLKANALIFLITRKGSVTVSELADLMFRSSNNITWLVDNLEQDGLVRRRRISKDRRTVHVQVTSAGLAYVSETLAHIDSVNDEVMSSLDSNELESLRKLIWKIVFNLSSGRAYPPEYHGDVLIQGTPQPAATVNPPTEPDSNSSLSAMVVAE